jgi:hypothetical protein
MKNLGTKGPGWTGMFFKLFNDLLQKRVLLTEFYPSIECREREQGHRVGDVRRIPGQALTKGVKRRRQVTNDVKSCMTMLLLAVGGLGTRG